MSQTLDLGDKHLDGALLVQVCRRYGVKELSDLVTKRGLKPWVRPEVLKDARLIYAAMSRRS